MIMKNTLLGKKIKQLVVKTKSKREHNLIGAWRGKKTKVLKQNGNATIVENVAKFSDSLRVNTEFKFSWTKAKTGLIQFRNDYSNLVFKTQQMLGFEGGKDWEIKRLTFNKLIIVERNEDQNTFIEYHFEKEFRDYDVG